jgi:plasmid segregation protein ParM
VPRGRAEKAGGYDPPFRVGGAWTLRDAVAIGQRNVESNLMEAIVRAIDVGFGNTKYVLAAQGGRVECAHFASIAYDSAHDNSNDALGSKRKTVCVPVGGMWYEVGPDVALAADGFVGRNHHDDYIRTPEYRAFTAGALHFT